MTRISRQRKRYLSSSAGLLLRLLLLFQSPLICVAADYPSSISLNVGIFHVPPYVYNIQELPDQPESVTASGFCPEMLERLQVYAAQDQVELTYNLKLAPPTYDGALDQVAMDCNTTANPQSLEDCQAFDIIAVDYYYTTARAMRIEYTPVWLHGAISAVRFVPDESNSSSLTEDNVLSTYVDLTGNANADKDDFITMAQASREHQPVCLVAGTSIVPITLAKFPGADYVMCPDQQACLDLLKQGNCRLYVDDRLQLRYRAVSDATLVVSSETFNPQYVTWVMNERTLQPLQLRLLKRWLIAAHQNGTLGELYEKYFEKQPCPTGRAGPSCDLPCSALHGEANIHGTCVCKSPKWTGPDCATEVPEELNLIPKPLKILSYCLLSINATLILLCGAWLFLHWHSQQVQMSQPSFLLLVLLGCAISSSTILALAQEPDASSTGKNGGPACMAIPWLYSIGFCVTFGTLFAKIRRVYVIFKSSAECKRVQVSFLENVAVIGLVLLVDVIILTVWTIVDPLRWQRVVISADQFGEALVSEGFCSSEHWVAFGGAIAGLHLVLLLVGSWLCYLSRHIPTKFSEGKYVSIAMVSNLQIFLVGVPVLIVVGSEPATSFFVRSVVIWMNDLVVVSLIFGNLIRSVNSADHVSAKDEIRSAIQEFSRHHDHGSEDGMDQSWHSGISATVQETVGRISQLSWSLHSATTEAAKPAMQPAKHPSIRTINASWKATMNMATPAHVPQETSSVADMSESKNQQAHNSMNSKRSSDPREDFLAKDSWAQANIEDSEKLDDNDSFACMEGGKTGECTGTGDVEETGETSFSTCG